MENQVKKENESANLNTKLLTFSLTVIHGIVE
jgi:hypothetical protein